MEEQERRRAEDRGSGGGKGNRVWVQGQRGGALNRGAETASTCGPGKPSGLGRKRNLATRRKTGRLLAGLKKVFLYFFFCEKVQTNSIQIQIQRTQIQIERQARKTMQMWHECTTNKTSSFNFIKTTNHYLFLLNSL